MWSETKKQELLRRFGKLYPDPKSELTFSNDFELVVSVILSAQCTDKKVNEVTPSLFRAYPNFKRLSEAEIAELEKIIRPINYYRTKARNLIRMAQSVREEFRGKLPQTREGLSSLHGIGRKTASVILSEKNIEPAFPVDTHVFRVSRRLKLARSKVRDKVEEQVKKQFEPPRWRELHHWLIFHGRRICKAQRPLCEECALSDLCASSTSKNS
ncbi:MAG: endonuclease III [Bdellovibrionales bacterium]|nr:endonuclease III [Bdellovibrionales bacterium]